MTRRVTHAFDEVEQVAPVGVGGVAADGFNACSDIDALAVELQPAPAGAIVLNVAARRAGALVADEHHRVAFIGQHAREIVDHPPPVAMPLAAITTAGR